MPCGISLCRGFNRIVPFPPLCLILHDSNVPSSPKPCHCANIAFCDTTFDGRLTGVCQQLCLSATVSMFLQRPHAGGFLSSARLSLRFTAGFARFSGFGPFSFPFSYLNGVSLPIIISCPRLTITCLCGAPAFWSLQLFDRLASQALFFERRNRALCSFSQLYCRLTA